MKIVLKLLVLLMLIAGSTMTWAKSTAKISQENGDFEYKITPIPPNIEKLLKEYGMWHPGCPVPLSDLAYLKLSYWGMNNKKNIGFLIVNKDLAKEVVDIFYEIYQQRFPIERMEPIPLNDAVAHNDTSAFYCRANRSQSSYSLHSYGSAIDINTFINPYIKDKKVLPIGADAYIDRSKSVPGMIHQGDKIYNIFIQHGWRWGGDYENLKDYMHFEKLPDPETSDQ